MRDVLSHIIAQQKTSIVEENLNNQADNLLCECITFVEVLFQLAQGLINELINKGTRVRGIEDITEQRICTPLTVLVFSGYYSKILYLNNTYFSQLWKLEV